MKYNKYLIIILSFLFASCLSYDNYNTTTPQHNNDNRSSNNRNSNISAYILANDENLSTFLQTQNKLNDYASHENVPTESRYRELFTEYNNLVNEQIGDNLNNITDKEKKSLKVNLV